MPFRTACFTSPVIHYVPLEDLGNELALPVARHLDTLDLARGSYEVALVAAIALSLASRGDGRSLLGMPGVSSNAAGTACRFNSYDGRCRKHS